MNFFGAKEFLNRKFDLKKGCKNEFKDTNEKLCSWSRKRVSHKIDFKAQWLRNGHADSVRVKLTIYILLDDYQETRMLSISAQLSFRLLSNKEKFTLNEKNNKKNKFNLKNWFDKPLNCVLNGSKLFQEEKIWHLNIAKVYFWNYIFFSYRL